MAEKDPQSEGPSLELPSLFGRRKKQKQPDEQPPADAAATERTQVIEEPPAVAEPEPVAEPDTEPTQLIVEPPRVQEPPAPPAAPPPAPAASTPAGSTRAASAPAPTKQRTAPTVPDLAGNIAAPLVGAVVGAIGCVLTFLGLKGCELVTGTDSCGGPGLLVLIAIVVAMVLFGTALLKLFSVADAGNVSFLGVSIMTVVALLFLIDYLYDPWMFVVIPVVTALTYAMARWITTRYVDDDAIYSTESDWSDRR